MFLFRDIVNELRRLKIISQSLTNDYTMNQCYELKMSTPEVQANFLYYMMIKLIQKEGYLDETTIKQILIGTEKSNIILKHILRQGFLTIDQITQSAKDFFLQDVSNLSKDNHITFVRFSTLMKIYLSINLVNIKQLFLNNF